MAENEKKVPETAEVSERQGYRVLGRQPFLEMRTQAPHRGGT